MSKVDESVPLKNARRGRTIITIVLTGDEQVHDLNLEYRDKDHPTDVLSFNIDEQIDESIYHLGDVVVNVEQAERQAPEYDNDVKHEIAALVEHGVLHLLGIDHTNDDEDRDDGGEGSQ